VVEEANIADIIGALSPDQVMRMAAPAVVERGADYADRGAVLEFESAENGRALIADVAGTRLYTVRISSSGQGRLRASCDCPAADANGPCKHVIATLLTATRALGSNGSATASLAQHRDTILRKTSITPPDLRTGSILVDAGGDPLFSFAPDDLHGQIEQNENRMPEVIRPFCGWHGRFGGEESERAFLQWLAETDGEFPVRVRTEGDWMEVEHQPAGHCALQIHLRHQADRVIVRQTAVDDDDELLEHLKRVGHTMLVQEPEGRFFTAEIPPVAQELLTSLAAHEMLCELPSELDEDDPLAIDGRAHQFSVGDWNMLGLSRPAKEDPIFFQHEDAPSKPHIDSPIFGITLHPVGRDVRIDIKTPAGLPFSEPMLKFWEIWNRLLDDTRAKRIRATAAKSRRHVLARTMWQLLHAETVSEVKAIIDKAAKDDAFQGLSARRAMTACLREYADWLAERDHRIIVASDTLEGDLPPWLEIPPFSRQVAPILEKIFEETDAEFADTSADPRPLATTMKLLPILPALSALCRERGVPLHYDGRTIKPATLQLKIQASASAYRIDWFELKPQVWCDGSLIPQSRWEEILKKGHFVDENGEVRLIELRSEAALRRFQKLLERQQQEDNGEAPPLPIDPGENDAPITVPRLRIFDWAQLRSEGVECDLPEEETRVLESLTKFEGIPEAPLPPGLRATLRPYQKQGYDWLAFLYTHRFGACLADDMGLGKTVQTIALLLGLKTGVLRADPDSIQHPHLMVLPPTLLFNWRHEIETFAPDLSIAEYAGPQRSPEAFKADVVLTTYEIVRRDLEKLLEQPFHVLVFDEAQAIKNLPGGRSQAVRQLESRFTACLTGTPLENHAGEYYSILELALPGLFGNHAQFLAELRDPSAPQPLYRAKPFVLRRTKEHILKDLPPKVESDVYLEMTEKQRAYYTRTVAEVRKEVMAAFKDNTAQQAGIVALSALTRLRQVCISPAILDPKHKEVAPKISFLLDKLQEVSDEGHAVLLFSQFTRALDMLEKHLKDANLDYVRIDGKTPSQKRKPIIAKFQKPDGPPVFLISLKTGGVGLNLTRASYVFHLDPWWNPAVERQATDRAHRIGQQNTVFVNRVLMKHSVEEKIMELKAQKQALFEEVLGGTDASKRTGGLVTRDDMDWLLSSG